MIRLAKSEEPAVLARNGERWTAVVIEKAEAGETPTEAERRRYNHPDIKRALVVETHGKCAYCESKIRHVSYGDIEHVMPKANDPSRWFEWTNLTLACDVCNTKKSDSPAEGEEFIDPYGTDPEEHFWQLGPIVCARPGCDAAQLTERLLDLNRANLVERRRERQTRLLKMLDSVERCRNPHLRSLLWEEFKAQAEPQNEYAALSRTIVKIALSKLAPPLLKGE